MTTSLASLFDFVLVPAKCRAPAIFAWINWHQTQALQMILSNRNPCNEMCLLGSAYLRRVSYRSRMIFWVVLKTSALSPVKAISQVR